LRASPIDVSRLAKEALFDRMRTSVLTSATLAVDGSFDYVKSRLGIREASQVRVPSEFDFTRQALLYLPRRIPSPKSPTFSAAAATRSPIIRFRSPSSRSSRGLDGSSVTAPTGASSPSSTRACERWDMGVDSWIRSLLHRLRTTWQRWNISSVKLRK